MVEPTPSVEIRTATEDDRLGVRRVVDGALLVVDDLPGRLADDHVLVAVPAGEDGPVLGAAVLRPHDGTDPGGDGDAASEETGEIVEIEAIAVRHARRGKGIGTALVEAIGASFHVVVAEFDPAVRPFYEALGFEISCVDDGRLRGRLTRSD